LLRTEAAVARAVLVHVVPAHHQRVEVAVEHADGVLDRLAVGEPEFLHAVGEALVRAHPQQRVHPMGVLTDVGVDDGQPDVAVEQHFDAGVVVLC